MRTPITTRASSPRASRVSLASLAAVAVCGFAVVASAGCGGANADGKCPVAAAGSTSATAPAATLGVAGAAEDPSVDAKLRMVLEGKQRSDANRARDVYRHPRETLEFFGIRPDSKVVEINPGGGWYTEILGPFLHDGGQLTVTNGDENGAADKESTKHAKELLAKLAGNPAAYSNVKTVHMLSGQPINLGADGSADLVVTFRNLHNFTEAKTDGAVLAAAFKVLHSGGTLGIVDHRAAPGADVAKANEKGYLPEAWVIDLVQKAGFKLAGKSEINSNPKDTKDYPKGVWTLPPSYELGAQDHAKYEGIGESDRMTLKFVKP